MEEAGFSGTGLAQYRYRGSTPFPIRTQPSISSARTGLQLQTGEIYSVSQTLQGADGVKYLRLSDGRGWVFTEAPVQRNGAGGNSDGKEFSVQFGQDFDCRDPPIIPCCALQGESSPFASVGLFERVDLNVDTGVSKYSPVHQIRIVDRTFSALLDGPRQSYTQEQQDFRASLALPRTASRVPFRSRCSASEGALKLTERESLLELFRDYAFSLYMGMFMKQMTPTKQVVDIHCRLVDNLSNMRLDACSGVIYEFPLAEVVRVCRMRRDDDIAEGGFLIFIEFKRWEMVFCFDESDDSYEFLVVMELLVLKAKEMLADNGGQFVLPQIWNMVPGQDLEVSFASGAMELSSFSDLVEFGDVVEVHNEIVYSV